MQSVVQTWFGAPLLHAGETRTSSPIPLPALDGLVVFKVGGTDTAGHHVAAWTVAVPAP
jgi:hypothetical protein